MRAATEDRVKKKYRVPVRNKRNGSTSPGPQHVDRERGVRRLLVRRCGDSSRAPREWMGGRGWHVPAKLTARCARRSLPMCAGHVPCLPRPRARTGAGVTSHAVVVCAHGPHGTAGFGATLTPPWVERARHCTDDQSRSSSGSGWVGLDRKLGHRDVRLSPRPDHCVHERVIGHRYRPRTIRRRPRFVHLRSVRLPVAFRVRSCSARPSCCCVFYYWRIITSRYYAPAMHCTSLFTSSDLSSMNSTGTAPSRTTVAAPVALHETPAEPRKKKASRRGKTALRSDALQASQGTPHSSSPCACHAPDWFCVAAVHYRTGLYSHRTPC
jgi:hypothetical protein